MQENEIIPLDDLLIPRKIRSIVMQHLELYKRNFDKLDFEKRILAISLELEQEAEKIKQKCRKLESKWRDLYTKNKELKELLSTNKMFVELKAKNEKIKKIASKAHFEKLSHLSALEKITELKLEKAKLKGMTNRKYNN